jgi:hypothetical protein
MVITQQELDRLRSWIRRLFERDHPWLEGLVKVVNTENNTWSSAPYIEDLESRLHT